MRRHYAQTVTLVDGSSIRAHGGSEPTSPAQTRITAAEQANEPERIEIPAVTLMDPAVPAPPTEGGTQKKASYGWVPGRAGSGNVEEGADRKGRLPTGSLPFLVARSPLNNSALAYMGMAKCSHSAVFGASRAH